MSTTLHASGIRDILVAILLVGVAELQLLATSPCVQFDVAEVATCRDVTPAEFRAANPDEKLIEARIHVSSFVRLHKESSLVQLLYVFESPHRSLRVVDYFPKTELAARTAGNIAVETSHAKTSNFGLNAHGGYDHKITADANASKGSTFKDARRFELLPPLQLLAASGTLQRGAAAYFKLKPSPRTALEGSKEFAIVGRVPAEWRGDLLWVRVAAYGQPRGLALQGDAEPICGAAGFTVALYMEGDGQAKQLAWNVANRERQLRTLARSRQRMIDERKFPSLGHKLGAVFSVVEPKIPDRWLERVVGGALEARAPKFNRYLPEDVRSAVDDYRQARRELRTLAS